MSNRHTFLQQTVVAGIAIAAFPQRSVAMTPAASASLRELLDGNARFVADRPERPPLTARRLELAVEGQRPFAIVVSCSDSRVPVETVFDQAPGYIFGIRVAGNFVDDHGLGSIEYSVATFESSLILVLGHSDCGAVKATLKYVKEGTTQPSHIQSLVDQIAPAAKATKGEPGDWLVNATARNVHDNIARLSQRSPIVAAALDAKKLSIAGGIYDLHTGKVSVVT
jgi:carbonic anhydrase